MKILVVLSRVPFPLEKGDKLRAYHQIKGLSARHEIVLCCLSEEPLTAIVRQELDKYCSEVHILKMKKSAIYSRLLAGAFSSLPYQVHYFKDERLKSLIADRLKQGDIDHIYCQLVRCAELVRGITSAPKTLDYMDALSLGMKRRLESSSVIKRPIVQAEYRRLARYEADVFSDFDQHTIISEIDREAMEIADKKKIDIILNGVDLDFFSPRENAAKHDLVFVGNLSYAPNVDCVKYLITDILPEMRKSRPETTLLIAGASPAAEVRALSAARGVTLSGWVEDIRDAYASARLFVAPLRIGTGLQNKLLEALAMGIPAVTSSLANAALGGAADKEIAIGDTAVEVAKVCLELLDDDGRCKAMAQKGRSLVEEKYSWGGAVSELEKVLWGAR